MSLESKVGEPVPSEGAPFLHVGTLLGLVLLMLAVNAAWQWLATDFGFKRYALSAESLLAVACLVAGWRWIGSLFFALSVMFESAQAGASVLKLFDVQQLWTMARYTLQANRSYLMMALVGVLALGAAWWGLLWLAPRVRGRWLGAVLLIPVLMQFHLSVDDGNFLRPMALSQDRLLLGSAAWQLNEQMELNAQVHELGRHDNVEYVEIRSPSAVQTVWGTAGPSARKVLVVVAESWGLPQSTHMLEAQLAPLREMTGDGRTLSLLETGSVRAVGATAMGEFRELCARLPTKLNLREISRERLGDCLPALLHDRGYRTVGIHGASVSMYDRRYAYPAYGLEQLLFSEQLGDRLPSRCHSFPGLCDHELADVVEEQFEAPGPVFVYWLSLNSHLPYDRRDLRRERPQLCRGVLPDAHSEALCTFHQLHVQFFESLADVLKSPALQGADVLVVGDHAPPFRDRDTRRLFAEQQVPFVHVRVRSSAQESTP